MGIKSGLIYLFLFVGAFSLLLFVPDAQAAWYVDRYGYLVYEDENVKGVVYAHDDDDDEGSSGSGSSDDDDDEGSSGSGSSGSGSSGTSNTGSSSGGTGGTTSQSSSVKKTSTSSEDEDEEDVDDDLDEDDLDEATNSPKFKIESGKTEIIFGEGEKIKTRTKNGETRTDIYSGGVKVRIEQKDGRLIIKAETEEGVEQELGQQQIFKIAERIEKNVVRVATGSGDRVIIIRGGVGAATNFPLSVDLATNELIVNTPAGSKSVAVLPDAAIQNILAANVIDRLGPSTLATEAPNLTNVDSIITLGFRSGVPVYEIAGISDQKLLRFIPVSIHQTVFVSPETGEVVGTQKTIVNTLLDLASI